MTENKTFQETVVDAITTGTLEDFRRLCVGRSDINRRLLPHKELKPVPKYNTNERYISIKGPTILMFAILCERDDIVEYVLSHKEPDLLKMVEGYAAIHLAAMIADYKCLYLLLQQPTILNNIDMPVDLPGTVKDDSLATTALHIAVSNRRDNNVYLLLDPPLKQGEDGAVYQGANINQKASSYSTPLYIAAHSGDYKMIRLLLAYEPDPSIQGGNLFLGGDQGRTPLEHAKERLQKEQERWNNLPAPYNKQKNPQIEAYNKTIQLLTNAGNQDSTDIGAIKKVYARRFKKEIDLNLTNDNESEDDDAQSDAEESSDSESDDEDVDDSPEQSQPKKKSSKSKTNNKLLNQILEQLQELNRRVGDIENNNGLRGALSPSPQQTTMIHVNKCTSCQSANAKQCPTCHKFFCDKCFNLPPKHACAK